MIKPIKTDNDYKAALKAIDELMNAEPDTKEGDALDVLVTLAEAYEAKHFPIDAPDPVEAIKFYMEQSGLEQTDLANLLGPPRASEILKRYRRLTLPMIRTLTSEWGIPAECLLKEYKTEKQKCA